MGLKQLFGGALELKAPKWGTKIEFSPEKRRFALTIDFPPGSEFPCLVCGRPEDKAYDATWEEW